MEVEPGREHFIDLSAIVVSTDDIKEITPEARDCFFPDEGDLEFYKRYTFSNCRLECAIKRLEKIFGCVPWHLPRVNIFRCIFKIKLNSIQNENSTTCDPWAARKFIAHMRDETRNCSQCRSDCELTTYSTTETSSEFRFVRLIPLSNKEYLSGSVTQEIST